MLVFLGGILLKRGIFMDMFRPQNPSTYGTRASAVDLSRFMSYVYGWMMCGILITSLVAYQVASSPQIMASLFKHSFTFWGLVILQLGLVFVLSASITSQRMGAMTTAALYVLYSALTGLTFSVILIVYTQQSIASAFLLAAASFGGLSLFGYVTKRDLGPVASFCMMGLFGLIGASLLAIFIPSLMGNSAQMVMGAIGVIVFSGLTAYDTQKIKALYQMNLTGADTVTIKKASIRGALMLYLDFINLFLSILRLMGDRK